MRCRILVVDDSRTVRRIVRRALAGRSCEILEAVNGAEGLDLAARVQPDLILLDCTMPVMAGPEMLARLQADPRLRAVPLLLLTPAAGSGGQLPGEIMAACLEKPFTAAALGEAVGRLLRLA